MAFPTKFHKNAHNLLEVYLTSISGYLLTVDSNASRSIYIETMKDIKAKDLLAEI
jgi:hypothetical protein